MLIELLLQTGEYYYYYYYLYLLSCVQFFVTPCTVALRLLWPWNSSHKNTGVNRHPLPQKIFLTQGTNLGLLHCRQILYHLSYQGKHTLPQCWGREKKKKANSIKSDTLVLCPRLSTSGLILNHPHPDLLNDMVEWSCLWSLFIHLPFSSSFCFPQLLKSTST